MATGGDTARNGPAPSALGVPPCSGPEPAWVHALRQRGSQRFGELGLPSPHEEDWRNTNVAPLAEIAFRSPDPAADREAPPADLPAIARGVAHGPRLVFLDTRPAPGSADGDPGPGAVWIGSLRRALATIPDRIRPLLEPAEPAVWPPFQALNTAALGHGAVVLVPPGLELAEPILVLYLATGAQPPVACHPRTLVAAGRGSRATVVEIYAGCGAAGPYFTNAVTQVSVADNAALDHYRVQLEGPGAFHVSSLLSRQTRDSHYASHSVDFGGRLVRHDVVSVLDGEGSHCQMNGLYLTGGAQHVDNHTVLDHVRPHGDSRELYKGILDGNSRTVFNGRIVVRPGAQKTDAKQSNRNLLLSSGALAQTRPQLEIFADDVKCTHGATIGRLDDEALLYLRARALPRQQARDLLIGAFAGEVLDTMRLRPLREALEREVAHRLHPVAVATE
jgi:Fe-S cluster assembly protein SufD